MFIIFRYTSKHSRTLQWDAQLVAWSPGASYIFVGLNWAWPNLITIIQLNPNAHNKY